MRRPVFVVGKVEFVIDADLNIAIVSLDDFRSAYAVKVVDKLVAVCILMVLQRLFSIGDSAFVPYLCRRTKM